jgi:two-component system OmpR family response regulator
MPSTAVARRLGGVTLPGYACLIAPGTGSVSPRGELSGNRQVSSRLRCFAKTVPSSGLTREVQPEGVRGEQPRQRVLVVDDEESITDLVATALRYEGLQVEIAASGRDALTAATSFRPHLIVLDVMLPDLDGFEVQRRLAADRLRVPILFLSARGETDAKVRGLTMGADDYVTKPFSLEELVARVHAVLRRSGQTEAPARLQFADLEMDEDTREVWRGEERVELSPTEFNLLRYLLLNARRVVSKAQIVDHVWRYDFGGDLRVVESYISHLRKKVDFKEPRLIHTVRGVGYSLRLPR